MNGQNNSESAQNSRNRQTIILAVLATALIVGRGVYAWQQSQLSSTEARLQEQITSLQNQITSSEKQVEERDATSKTEEDATKGNSSDQQKKENREGFTKLKEEGRYVYYSGTATIGGTYEEFLGTGPSQNMLCFYPDEPYEHLIPRENGDTRTLWLCFEEQDKAKTAFGINDSDLSSKNAGCIEGKATIKISNYKATKIEGADSDSATLAQIVSKEAYEYKNSCSK